MTSDAIPRWYRRLACFAVAWLLVVYFLGANVTSTKSGDAIPTWPWGWVGESAPEWIELWHRFGVGLSLPVALALAFGATFAWPADPAGGTPLGAAATARMFSTRPGWAAPGLRKLAWWSAALVLVQAGLGGVRVLLGAEDEGAASVTAMKVVHATVAQIYFVLAVALAARTAKWWDERPERPLDDTGLSLLRGGLLTVVALLVQSFLGALGRHDVLPREVHLVAAIPAILLAARLVLVASQETPKDLDLVRTPAGGFGFVLAVQLVLGISAYIVSMEAPDPLKRDVSQVVTLNLHLVLGAAMTGLALLILLRAARIWGLPTDERIAEARRSAEAAS